MADGQEFRNVTIKKNLWVAMEYECVGVNDDGKKEIVKMHTCDAHYNLLI